MANSSFEESLGVGGGCRDHHAQAWGMEKVCFEALAVLRAELMSAALWRANDYRHCGLAAEHVVYFGRTIDYLIHREQREVYSHQFDYRSEATHRGSNTSADNSQFRNRSIADALFAVYGEQSVGDLECAPEVADFLAHDEDPLVAVEFLTQGLVQCFAIGDLRHSGFPGHFLRRVNALAEVVERRLRAFVGKLDRVVDSRRDFRLDLGQLRVGGALFME